MCETANGLELISKIYLSKDTNVDTANEILVDIENHITDYMKEKYNAVVGGSGRLIYRKGELNDNQK
jgi:hypothetical protein